VVRHLLAGRANAVNNRLIASAFLNCASAQSADRSAVSLLFRGAFPSPPRSMSLLTWHATWNRLWPGK
jgi:hypothetical protein